jgi:hypothetical protein
MRNNISRIVIDLQTNSGGSVSLAFNNLWHDHDR